MPNFSVGCLSPSIMKRKFELATSEVGAQVLLSLSLLILQKAILQKKKSDVLQQKIPYGPCYKLMVWYKYYSVISVQFSIRVKRFNMIGCKL